MMCASERDAVRTIIKAADKIRKTGDSRDSASEKEIRKQQNEFDSKLTAMKTELTRQAKEIQKQTRDRDRDTGRDTERDKRRRRDEDKEGTEPKVKKASFTNLITEAAEKEFYAK